MTRLPRLVWMLGFGSGCGLVVDDDATDGRNDTGMDGSSTDPEPIRDLPAAFETWVGQIQRTVTVPGLEPGVFDTGPQRVWLVLDRSVPSELGGGIVFGEGDGSFPPLPDRRDFYPLGFSADDHVNLVHRVTEGVEHTLLDARQDGDLLSFSVAPLEVYEPWCARREETCAGQQCSPDWMNAPIVLSACTLCSSVSSLPSTPAPCLCTGGSCEPNLVPRISFHLRFDGDQIEGELLSAGGGFLNPTTELRLRRVE